MLIARLKIRGASQDRIKILLFSIAAFLLLFNAPAYARHSPEDISVSGSFGFGGFRKTQVQIPIFVEITNTGELFEGWVLADFQSWVPPTYYTHPVVIPPGGSVRLEIGCFGCFDAGLCSVPVSVMSSDGDPLKEETLQAYVLGRSDTLLLHLGRPVEPIGNLREGSNPGYLAMAQSGIYPSSVLIDYPPAIFPVVYDPDDLPTQPLLLESISVITAGLGTYLSLDQSTRDNILEYVRHGGNLLIYYRDGIDPVDGWRGDILLPVDPEPGRGSIAIDDFLKACEEVFPDEPLGENRPPRALAFSRGIHGEIIRETADHQEEFEGMKLQFFLEAEGQKRIVWDRPDGYPVLKVKPLQDCETVAVENFDSPILVVRNLGSGHAGFAAYNPFTGGPTAEDEPIVLPALYGLLDPVCPTQSLISDSVISFHALPDARVENFFMQGSITEGTWVMKWLDTLGPALIYLMALPLIALLARGRGNLILALFVLWSVAFTGITFYMTSKPHSDEVRINEAALYWCEAVAPDEEIIDSGAASRVYSAFSYSTTKSTPHTLSWNYPGTIVDEIVDPITWPYGSITIEESVSATTVRDLPLESIAFRSNGSANRIFTVRRSAPELTATGRLLVGPDHANLVFDAKLPFPTVAGRLIVNSHNLWVGKNFGMQDEDISLDVDLVYGQDITRRESLFPLYQGEFPVVTATTGIESDERDLGYTLETFWNHVFSRPVGRAQAYTLSRTSGRPMQAYIQLASTEMPSDVEIDHGELIRHSVAIVVITIPIIYEE